MPQDTYNTNLKGFQLILVLQCALGGSFRRHFEPVFAFPKSRRQPSSTQPRSETLDQRGNCTKLLTGKMVASLP
jgi:hypothetical protein